MTGYAIGIDTGGTYTDAVIVDLVSQRVLAKAKALTTRGDLAVGVAEALGAVLAATGEPSRFAAAIRHVALSTTLATNAIVEGHGSPVGVILIGFDEDMAARTGIARALPDARVLRVTGGHDHEGREQAPLDETAIIAFLRETGPTVAAYAVTAQYSVRNPAHEQRARALIAALAARPATLSSELAQSLDAPRRALTAALNARIISRITALIEAVRDGMARHGVGAPLLVVKGDGTLATAAQIAERPIETILSGPAASTIGARFLSGLRDLVVADIGGTTTDIAVLENGWPRLDRSGALVGRHRTMVQAIEMRTFGLGGDSEVGFDEAGRLEIRAGRIWPLALLGARFPGVIATMRAQLADPAGEPYAGRFALRLPGAPPPLAEREAALLERIGATPTPLGRFLHGPLARRSLDRLVALGLAALAGFTPSDAAHVLGHQGQWSREASVLGALLLQRGARMLPQGDREAQARAVAQEVFNAVAEKSGRVLIGSLAGVPLDEADEVVTAAASGRGRLGRLAVRLAPVWPVVAVGGPAPVFYPEVARRLGCRLVLPEHAEVANAIGAAVALMKARAVVEISSAGPGGWRVHHQGEPIAVPRPEAALALARELAEQAALAAARAAGIKAPRVALHVERIDLPNAEGDQGLIAATVFAECVGEHAADPDQPPAAPCVLT
jgi:N-methylhydantoinase A/oxoprolinase/acetone carboxylase beta subunit